jgi:glycerol-3-phosphate dehydrogenase
MPAGIIAKSSDGKVMMMHRMGRNDHVVEVGTSTRPYEGDEGARGVTPEEAEYLLGEIKSVSGKDLSLTDVMSGQSAERPALVEKEGVSEKKETREHHVYTERSGSGFTSIVGGSATAASRMAEDLISSVFSADSLLHGKRRPSVRSHTRLLGAAGFAHLSKHSDRLAKDSGLTPAQVSHLMERYGSETQTLLDLVRADPRLAQPIPGAPDSLMVEVAFAVDQESARKLEDVLDRRLRVTLQTYHRGLKSAPAVAQCMAERLGWSPEQLAAEIRDFHEFVRRENGELPLNTPPPTSSPRAAVK